MLVRLFFILGALSIPVSILVNQEAIGIFVAFLFMLMGGYFSNPKFKKD